MTRSQGTIRHQVKLPITVAMNVVLQGIRIRFGRSLVTVTGVVLGIAFLMAILTGQIIRRSVADETRARDEVNRMHNFLVAEMGPVRERVIGVVQSGPLSELERRFVQHLVEMGVATIRWAAADPAPRGAPLPGPIRMTTIEQVAEDASAVLFVGRDPAPRAGWARILTGARQKVLASTRVRAAINGGRDSIVVGLARKLRPDERTKLDADEKKTRFRTVWLIAIALVVTVIGICNAMLMSVTERFREIGTMKCLGAMSSFIRQIFLIESTLVGSIGSVAGGFLGALFAIITYGVSYGPWLVISSLDVPRLLMMFVGSVMVGVILSIVAGVYPARIASRMVPATALRTNV